MKRKKSRKKWIKRKKSLETNFDDNSNIEHKYELLKVELQEISLRTEENVNSEISFKSRELERTKLSLKQLVRDEEDFSEELAKIRRIIKEKVELVEKKKLQEEELGKKLSLVCPRGIPIDEAIKLLKQ